VRMNKLTSGRWILTITCALVFIYATMKGILEAQAVSAILAMVFQAYFSRDRKGETNV